MTPMKTWLKLGFIGFAIVSLFCLGLDAVYAQPKGKLTLHDAALIGDTASINRLLESGENVNSRDGEGATPLHYAVSMGQYDIAKLLIAKGADVNASTHDGNTPLHWAAAATGFGTKLELSMFNTKVRAIEYNPYQGQLEFVEELLRAGAKVNAVTSSGMNPLVSVIALGCLNRKEASSPGMSEEEKKKIDHIVSPAYAGFADLLLRRGANVKLHFEKEQLTPLILAVKCNKPELVRVLLEHGASCADRDLKGLAAKDYAKTPEIISMLKSAEEAAKAQKPRKAGRGIK